MAWVLSFFFGGSSRAAFSALVIAILVAGSVFAYNRYVVMPGVYSKLEEAGKKQAELELQNTQLQESVKSLSDSMASVKSSMEAQLKITNDYIRSISEKENEIRSGRKSRDKREAEGGSETVLTEDQLQLDCLNMHFGDPTGECKNGNWIEYAVPTAKPKL